VSDRNRFPRSWFPEDVGVCTRVLQTRRERHATALRPDFD
jgi:hypothetical protein